MQSQLINEIIQEMLPFLNNFQEDKLQTVLRKVLSRYEVVEGNERREQELDYVALFLSAKRIEAALRSPCNTMRRRSGQC